MTQTTYIANRNYPPDTQFLLDKPLPSNADAERALLGAIILNNDLIADAAEILKPEDFYNAFHRRTFAAMLSLFTANAEIEPIAIDEIFKQLGQAQDIGLLMALTTGIPIRGGAKQHIELIREKAIARNLIKKCNLIAMEAASESETSEILLDRAEQSIYDLRHSNASVSETLGDIVLKSFNDSKDRLKNGAESLGLLTGFTNFDYLTAGLQKTDLILLAGRPSMGKSSLATEIALGVTDNQPDAVIAFFSLEMSKDQLATRMICSKANINSNEYRLGKLTPTEWQKAATAASELHDKKIIIDDTPYISVLEMKAKARKIAAKYKRLDLIIVDYLQLMKAKGESRYQEISDISRDSKSAAKDLNVPIIQLSQLSRACESRNDKRPLLSDLRESGSLEQDSDIVAFVYRDEY